MYIRYVFVCMAMVAQHQTKPILPNQIKDLEASKAGGMGLWHVPSMLCMPKPMSRYHLLSISILIPIPTVLSHCAARVARPRIIIVLAI